MRVIADNYATHKHLRVKGWLAARARFHVHFTSTSWLNGSIGGDLVQRHQPAGRTFRGGKELVHRYVQNFSLALKLSPLLGLKRSI